MQQEHVLESVQSVYSKWLMGVGGQEWQQQAGPADGVQPTPHAGVWWHAQQLHVWASLVNQQGL
jgi:hypothetical protein